MSEADKRERALWLADKLVGDYGSEAAQLLRYFASLTRSAVGEISEALSGIVALRAFEHLANDYRLKRAEEVLRSLLSLPSATGESMPEQLKMHPGVVAIVDKLSEMPRVSDWPAEDCRVLLGFCAMHAAYTTLKNLPDSGANKEQR